MSKTKIGEWTTQDREEAAWDLYASRALTFFLEKNQPSDLIGTQFTLAVEAAAITADRLLEERRKRVEPKPDYDPALPPRDDW